MAEEIVVGKTADGGPFALPIEELLTGRGFITGKSGAGKSNSAGVIMEQLLDRGHPVLIVDVEGEYRGLKEEFEVLHVGANEECDLQVGPEHAGKIAELALEQRIPIVLDVSGYVHSDEADELVRKVAQELFVREYDLRRPFLLFVEEVHEYIPQQGSLDETGQMLIQVAKRGRKRGLGMIGLSQRPAAVDKDFITQADLLIWHRLTWENDTEVVRKVVGSDQAELVTGLADGEAFVQADWSEADLVRVQFNEKRTHDFGEAPGLEEKELPEFKSIDESLLDELAEISDRHQRRQDRIAQLEERLEEKEEEIARLQEDLDDARDLQRLGEAFVDAARSSGEAGVEVEQQELLEEKNELIADLRAERDHFEEQVAEVEADRHELEEQLERLRGVESRIEHAERIEEQLDRARDVLGVEVDERVQEVEAGATERVDRLQERVDELEEENRRLRARGGSEGSAGGDLASMVAHDSVQAAVTTAAEKTEAAERHFHRILAILANSDGGGPLTPDEIAPLTDVSRHQVKRVCKALHQAGVVTTSHEGRSTAYALDRDFLETRIEVAEQQANVASS